MKKQILLPFFLTVFCSFISAQQPSDSFENSFWQWVSGSEISDKRMNETAPHFPRPDEYEYDSEQYDYAIQKWQRIYCFEYEALVNAPELTALNPYYTGYVDVIEMPYFIRPLSSYDKPLLKDTGNAFEDELEFELDVQAWYFVFHPDEFYKVYKMKPTFPDWFDPEVYRAQVIAKIEEAQNQEKLENN